MCVVRWKIQIIISAGLEAAGDSGCLVCKFPFEGPENPRGPETGQVQQPNSKCFGEFKFTWNREVQVSSQFEAQFCDFDYLRFIKIFLSDPN